MKNLEAVLKAAGSSLDKVVRCSVFLKDMNDFAAMNEVYGKFFKSNPPARTTVRQRGCPRTAWLKSTQSPWRENIPTLRLRRKGRAPGTFLRPSLEVG